MNLANNSSLRGVVARLLAALLRTEAVQRARRRAHSVVRKLLLAAYIYIGITLARAAARLFLGWEI
ncbi:MAG: hypothetical protein EXR43_05400 [Dehalococcoidia bacterium]|nr:hypothetical protein [Dehalococcoidia bacterium]